ncbi:glycosyltransferase family protein [Flindersiella endophytica]
MNGRTWRLGLLAVGLVAATVVFLWAVQYWRGFFDLSVYYGAINSWVGGGQLYEYVLPGTKYGFTYPPFAALTMLPMALVGWPVAIVVSLTFALSSLALVTYWLVSPLARSRGWPVWFTVVATCCLLAILEPVFDTVSFGQVNLVLLAFVFGDWRLLRRGSRWAGIGIGLAAAIKLTPAAFVGYLLVTRRWRAAAVASVAAVVATGLAAVLLPGTSRTFWTEALWQTSRVGDLTYASNQSLLGMLARLDPPSPSRLVWGLLVLGALAVWFCRVRGADLLTGFALTGVTGCLVSPISWVHHLVWLVPALLLLASHALRAAPGLRRRLLLGGMVVAYLTLASSAVFLWRWDFSGIDGFLGSSLFVWVSIGLLLGLPARADSVGSDRANRSPDAADRPLAGNDRTGSAA